MEPRVLYMLGQVSTTDYIPRILFSMLSDIQKSESNCKSHFFFILWVLGIEVIKL